MKDFLIPAIALAFAGTALIPAFAEERPAPKGPPQTMGDEAGKLPATGTVSGAVPDQGATPGPAERSAAGGSPKGPAQTMGDEPGKLPATGTVSGTVPKMTTPDASKK